MQNMESVEPNSAMACIWIVLSVLVATSSIFAIFDAVPYFAPAFLGLAWIVFLMGRQRTRRFALPMQKYLASMRWAGLSVALLASMGTILNSTL